ncbi:MAG: kelch repeat-containing protein, partial [Candidatus Kariarchaeum pelagius]
VNKKTILFGGISNVALDDTWAFDFETKTWTEMNPTNTPPASNGPVMAFDPVSEQVIMIPNDGAVGICGTYAYSYANNTWINLNPTNQPSCGNNYQRAIVYDNINNVILYTYGSGDTHAYNSTANTWTQLSVGSNPCWQDGPFYTFDQKYGKMIMFDSTRKTCYLDYNDKWSSDTISSPPIGESYGSGMIYDPILNQSILFGGGSCNACARNYTYSFDYETKTWNQIITDNAPSERGAVAMTYDSDQEMVILFGGKKDGGNLGDTWTFTPHEIINPYQVENLPEIVEYNLGTVGNIVFNITTSNATTYDILLNNEFINSYDYLDNDTITLDLNSIYSNYTFVNNDTNFEFSNLTLVFRNAQNDTYTVSINVMVFIILTTTETETEFSNSTDTETVTTTTNQVSTITETSTGNGNNTITEVSTLISTIINTVSENNGNSTNTLTENNNTPDLTSAFNNPNWLILVAAVGAAEIIRRRVS